MLYRYSGQKPKIASQVYIAPTAAVIGDVEIGTVVPPRTLFAGNPAVQKKELADEVIRQNQDHARHYCQLAAEYLLL